MRARRSGLCALFAASLVLTGFTAAEEPTAPGTTLAVWKHADGDANAGPEYAHIVELPYGIKLDVRFAVATVAYANGHPRAPVRAAVTVLAAPDRRLGLSLDGTSPDRRPGERADSLSLDVHVASSSTAPVGCGAPAPGIEITVLRLRPDGRIDQEATRPMVTAAELEELQRKVSPGN